MKILSTLVLLGFLVVPGVGLAYVLGNCNDYDAASNRTTCLESENCVWVGGTQGCEPRSTGGGTQPSGEAPTVVTSPQDLINLVERIGNWIFIGLLSVASVFLIFAGFKWVTAGGNPEEVNKARLMLINALIGVVIALLAKGMIVVIRGVIGG